MLIEYRIKRFDLVMAFFFNLRHSRRTQQFVFGASAVGALYTLFSRYRIHGHLTLSDFIIALVVAIVIILSIPAVSFVTAKTHKRKLSITTEGIETQIGSQSGRIAWKNVNSIIVTRDRIFITGNNANAFIIPSRAFISDVQRDKFIELGTEYHDKAQQP